MKIRVPATSANLGPGFDSCGIALSAYLTINVLGESEFWEIQHTMGEEIPTNEKFINSNGIENCTRINTKSYSDGF